MNKIFKVVWNRTIGSFVVTSELAKGRVKSSSEGAEGDVRASEEGRLKTLFRLTALSAALFGLSESAWAHPIINSEGGKVATGGASETAVGGGSARGVGSVAVGAFAKAGTRIEADGAIAIGGSQASTGAFADGNNSIAIGQASNANANKATSIGSDTIASHEWTSAIGARAEAKNLGATSLGSWTQATGEYSIAVGGSDAQGRAANAGTLASGSRSTAIGRNAKSAGADAIALGTSTQASGVEAVAIGQGAASTAAKALAFGQGAQAKESDTVAVGTGAQATLANSIAIGKDSVATGTYGTGTAGRAIAIGFNTKALGEDSVAIGSGVDANAAALAKNRQSVALGWQARATGTTQAVAIGPQAYASGAQSTSIGNNTRATGDSSIAIGGDDWDDAKKSVNAQYKALTGSDMSDGYQGTTSATAAVAVGVKAQATGALSTAFGPGTIASGLGASAFGVGASATQAKSVAIGAGSSTQTDASAVTEATVNGVTYRGFAGTEHITTGSQVSFGSAGYERQLKNVAPGAITATSTDAVNGSQLYALHVGAGNIAKSVADALGGGATVGNDPTNNQGSFVTLPSYDVLKGSDKPKTAGNGTAKFNTTPAKNVAAAMTNLNTYVNQGFAVKDNAGDAKGIVTPGESVQFADGNATTVTVDTEANGNTKIKYDVKVDDSTIKVVDGKLTGASQTHFYSVNSADKTKANYNNDGATAENAIAAGPEAKAAASNAVVIGNKATVEAAAGSDSTINGETTGEGSVAVGALSKASGKNATAIGQKANAYGQNSFAGGQDTESSGKSSVAVGDGSRATDDSTTAVGPYAKAQKAGASAFGFNANAQAVGSVAVGRQAQALKSNAVSVGNESKAKGEDTVAIGTSADAVQNRAMAIGKGAVANGADTIAFGAATKADQRYAIAIGSGNNAWKEDSVALGRAANADGAASLALGLNSHTRLDNAIALGNGANADHSNSIAIGKSSHAAASAGVAIGNDAQALKYSSVVIGDQAQSNNSRSVVIGYHASATNPAKPASAEEDYNQTVAIGAYANAWGDQSTAIGNNVDAKGNSSIAIGADDWDTVAVKTVEGTGKTVKEVYQDYTGDVMETGSYTHTTSSEAAVAIGTKSQAIGQLSTAFGTGTIAEGVASAAFGMGAKATQGNSVAIGAGSTTASGAIGVNEATVNNLKYSGFAGGNSVNPGDQVSFGSKNYERQLKNVAPGEISNTSTDAINGSQLYAVQNVLGNTAQTVKNVLGGDAAVDENGSITMSNIGNTGKGNIHDAIKSVKETAEKGWKLKANEEADSESEKIAAGDTVTVKQGKNIRVKRSSKDLTIETADDVAFNKVTVGNSVLTTDGLNTPQVTAGDSVLGNNGLNIANGANPVSLTKSGLDNGGNKVTNIADGVADTDAASYKQVKAAKTEVQKGTNVVSVDKTEGTDGHAIYTVNAKGTAVSAEGTDNGLKLTSSENTTTNLTTYNLDLSDKTKASLTKADSALQGIDVKVNDENVKTLTKDDSTLKFVNGTGTTAENKGGTVTFNVNKSTLTTGAGGVVSADTAGDAFATAADVAKAINKAVVDSEKTSVVAAGDNTHVAAVEAGNQTTYTVHADNTTVSVKDGGKLALKSSEATNSNHTKTTNYELDLSDDTKAEIQKGVDAKNIVDTKGITFSGNSGSPVTKKLDETLAIKGDDTNVVTESGTDGITVKLKDKITVQTVNADKLKAGDSVLTNDGLNIANGNNPVSLTKSGLNNGGNKITKVAKGENEDDAVNYAQLKELAEKGLTFDADGNTSTSSKKLGERVGIKGGNNITTSADSDNVTVKLNDDITLNSVTATTLKAGDSTLTNAGLVTPKVTAGDSVLTTDGLNIANGAAGSPVSLTKDGLNNGGNKVTNVAKGTVDTDGVNVSQLNPVAKALNTNIDPTTGEVAAPSFTVTKADGTKHPAVGTVQEALDKVGEEVTKGLNIVADNGSSEKVNLGDTVKYTSKDKNIVTTSGTGKAIDFSLSEKVTIGKDTANGGKPVVIDGKEGIVSGLSNTTLGTAPLAGSNKAATEAQLDATQVNLANVLGGNAANNNGNVTTSDIGGTGENNVHDAIKSVKATADKGWNLNANDETSSEKIAAGDTVTFKEGKNVKVSRNGKSITIATSDDVSFKTVTVGDSVLTDNGLTVGNGKAGKPVSLTKDGLNNGGNKVANVAAGEADTDAVNVAQLKAAAAKATSKVESGNGNIVVTPEQNADGSTTYKVATAPNLKADSFTAGDTVVNKDGVKVGDKVALGKDGLKAGDVNMTADGINAGNKAISNVAEGKKDTDAVNVAQLKAAAAKATSKVESGNGNIVVTPEQNADGSTTYKVATAPDLKADSLTTGDTVVNNDGVKVGDKVALTKDGLDNGGNKVANVAAGEADTDAVNVAQLKAAAAKATSKVESGNDNIVVKPEQNADGSTTYKVATAPDLKADSLTTGDTVVNNDGVKVGDKVALGKDGLKAGDVNITADGINAGNKAISNVAEGKKDTDAVNVGQLNRLTAAAKTEVEAGTNIASVSSKQGANKQTVYTINADGASVSAGSDKIVVTKGKKDANNVTDYAVDLSKAVKDDIVKGVAAKDAVDNKGISFAGDSGTTVANKLGDTVAVKGDANITTTAGANGIQVGLNKDLKVDSVTTGGVTVNAQGISIGAPTAYNPANTVSLSPNGLNNGGQRITNVAPAKEGTDAVNLNQLVGMGNALQNNIANVGKKAYAGVAGAIAQGSIPQVTRPGATGIGVGSGYYGGQSAMAIGVSAMSDGGNWIVKGNFSANTDGHVGVGAGALYQW